MVIRKGRGFYRIMIVRDDKRGVISVGIFSVVFIMKRPDEVSKTSYV